MRLESCYGFARIFRESNEDQSAVLNPRFLRVTAKSGPDANRTVDLLREKSGRES